MVFIEGGSKCLLHHGVTVLAGTLATHPHHRHLQFYHEQLDLTLLNELTQSLQDLVFAEFLTTEHQALGRQIANSPVEHLQTEEFLNQGVVLQQRGLESASHVVLVDQPALPRKVLVDYCQDCKDVSAAVAALEEFVIDAEDSEEELAGEWEVEFGVFANEFSNQGKNVEHTEFEILVLRVVLPRQEEEYLEQFSETGEVVHHFSHEIDMGHEDASVTLLEEEAEALEAVFEELIFSRAHVLCQLEHGFGSLGFILNSMEGGDEKLYRRFLKDDRGVRGL